MAKNAITHKLTTTETIKLSGIVSADGLSMNLDGTDKALSDFFIKLGGKSIDVTLTEKSEEEIEE